MKIETRAIHSGFKPNLKEGGTGDIVTPIHLASTFARTAVDNPPQGYEYSRSANPSRDDLEMRLASLENAKYALAFASGLAAETTALLSLLKAGEHLVASDDLYGGTRRLFEKVLEENLNIQVSFVDARDPLNIKRAIQTNTRVVWLETPTNPLLKLSDIQAVANICQEKAVRLIVDNTFMTPCFQQPLSLGADVVLHSTTKYLNGHSDSVGGALMLNDEAMHESIKYNQNALGSILSPFDAFLVTRGIKTLPLRMERHQQNALAMAKYLDKHPKVKKVIYPGLESFAQYELAQKQMKGFGGMISFELDSDLTTACKFVENCKLFVLAESLGGVKSLIEIPALMTHNYLSPAKREAIGLSDTLIRLSIGIEHVDDLQEDLDRAFLVV